MAAREDILRSVRPANKPSPLPPAWVSRRSFDHLALQFTAALQAVKGEVHQVRSWEQAVDRLGKALKEAGAMRVVGNDEHPVNRIDPGTQLPGIEWNLPGAENWREICSQADAGVTGAEAALAETGSVALTSGGGKSRLVSLLPPLHVALVPVSKLVTDLFAWVKERPASFPAQLVLVSGPSKTADIEQTLVVGVHGPKRFVVILYDDSSGR